MTKWLDNRTVTQASNYMSIGDCDTVRQWDKSLKKFVNISRPEVIKEYNRAIGGVDLFNRFISLHGINIRSKKWTLRLIFHAIDMAVCNSWLEYKIACERAEVKKKKTFLIY